MSGNTLPYNIARKRVRADRSNDAEIEAARGASAFSGAFLRLAELDGGVFERPNRYEAALWRQAVQIIWTSKQIRAR
jgi:hypothetical protein